MMMIDPDVPLRAGNSGSEYNNHTPGRHWPGFFVRMAPSAHSTSSLCPPTGGRVREDEGLRLEAWEKNPRDGIPGLSGRVVDCVRLGGD